MAKKPEERQAAHHTGMNALRDLNLPYLQLETSPGVTTAKKSEE